jgi:hypothetical protein
MYQATKENAKSISYCGARMTSHTEKRRLSNHQKMSRISPLHLLLVDPVNKMVRLDPKRRIQ